MYISKPLLFGAVVTVCFISSALLFSCGGTHSKSLVDNETSGGPQRVGAANLTGDATGKVASQGGTLTGGQFGEPSESMANGEADTSKEKANQANGGSDPPKTIDGNSDTFFSQLGRYKYEKFEPNEDMIAKAIVGFYRIEGAIYVPSESSGLKSEQAEIYDLWFKMPEGQDYKKIVDTYASKLESGYSKQQMETDKGLTTYFIIQEPKKWNKVIIIFQSNDEPILKIRVKFDKLLGK